MELCKGIFKRMPRIQTERLLLRKIKMIDAQDMYDYASRPEVTRYLLWYEHPDLSYTKRYIAYVDTQYRAGKFYDFAIIERESKRMIGTCGFARLDSEKNTGEIGYVLHPSFWGRGYATEAVQAIIRFGFEKLGLCRIEGRYMANNLASRRVMEKCGMQLEGVYPDLMVIKGRPEAVGICAILADKRTRE